MRKFLPPLFIFFFCLLKSQKPYPANVYNERPQNGIFNLKGKVKNMDETCWKVNITATDTQWTRLRQSMSDHNFRVSFNSEGKKTEQIFFAPSGKVKDVYRFSYDTKGLLKSEWTSKKAWKFKDHVLTDSSIYYILNKYVYDEQGKLIRTENSVGDSLKASQPDEMLILRENYKYDAKGRKTESRRTRGKVLEERTTFRYDSAGHLIQSTESSGSGKASQTDIYRYDAAGNCVEIVCKGNINSKQTFIYQKDTLASEEWYYPDGKFQDRKTFSRDKYGNITELQYLDSAGKSERIVKSVYTYDTNENWIRQHVFINGQLKYIFKRDFEYY